MVRERLKGLLERAVRKEKGSLETAKKFPKVDRSKQELDDNDDDSSNEDDERKNTEISQLNNGDKCAHQKTRLKPSRNSLLRRETQNRWKRNPV